MTRLTDKLCVVTGAGRGIGAAIARRFTDEGATVIVTDQHLDRAESIAHEINATAHRLDVAVGADWDAFAAAHPQIDVLVNNAGITGFEDSFAPQDPENASLSDWRRVHAVNLDGTFLGCRYAIRAMRVRGRGSIINISSRSGLVGIPGAAAYASSKAAIRNHTKSVALYCAEQGLSIRCNSVHPAAILTPMWDPMLGSGAERMARLDALTADTPLRRFGTVDEVAGVCAMLASDDGAYMTGAEINIDGGLLAGSLSPPVPAD
ncbi:SDR family oxidoreductase [Shimia sp. SDUM112013]|uniref:SDR family NAD(P)-dependent oxidoreductase n=1 Tax=Shimia sp. SDUM112013 TaxID=3136160 RepID=UPI0032F0565B